MVNIRISKDEALSFLLTYLVVEKSVTLELNQLSLFQLTSLAQQATDKINQEEAVIPHEVIEHMAAEYLEQNP